MSKKFGYRSDKALAEARVFDLLDVFFRCTKSCSVVAALRNCQSGSSAVACSAKRAKSKPIDVPPAVGRNFVELMHTFFAEPSGTKRDDSSSCPSLLILN